MEYFIYNVSCSEQNEYLLQDCYDYVFDFHEWTPEEQTDLFTRMFTMYPDWTSRDILMALPNDQDNEHTFPVLFFIGGQVYVSTVEKELRHHYVDNEIVRLRSLSC